MRSIACRKGTRLAALLLLAGCIESANVVGNAPENPTRELPHEGASKDKPATAAATRADQYKRRQNQADVAGPRVEEVDPEQARIGVATNRVFHRPDCEFLKGVATAEQIRFTSRWDALDGGYVPCDRCRSAR